MNQRKYFLYLILLISYFNISGLVYAISPEFFYNQKELGKAKAASYLLFGERAENIFSYDNNLKLGIFNYYSNNPSLAEQYFSKALKLAQDSLSKANAYYWLGRSCLLHNESEKATYNFAQVLNFNKNVDPEFLFFYGIALYDISRYEDALNCFLNFENQIKNQSRPKELPLFIGACALGKGDFILAEQSLNQDELQTNPKFFPVPTYLLGLTYYLDGAKDKSLDILRRVKADTISFDIKTRAHLVSGAIYFDRGDLTKAVNEFDAMLRDTLSKFNEQAYLRSAISYLKLKKSQKALARFDTLIQKYPNSPLNELAFYYKAQIYKQNQKWTQAKREYKKFLAGYPNSPLLEPVSYNLGQVLFLEENYIEAIPVLEDFLNEFPNSRFRNEVLFDLIQSCYVLGKDSKVQTYGEKFTQEFPSSDNAFEVHYKLGEIGIRNKDYRYAQQHLSQIDRSLLFPYALKELGDINYALDSLSLALDYYNFAERICTDTLIDEIRFNRENVYFKQGIYKSNLDMLKGFLAKYPESRKAAMVQYEIGEHYLKLGDAAQAIAEFDKVKNIESNSQYVPMAEMGKAQSYIMLGQTNQAIESYLKIVTEFRTVPFLSKAIYSLGSLYFSIQQYDSAVIFYNRIITELPKNQESELAFVELAKIYNRLGKFIEAADLLQQFITRYPHSLHLAQVYLDLVNCYKEMGKFVQAEKTIKEMFNKVGKTGDGYFKLGEINVLQNKPVTAMGNFFEAYSAYIKEQKKELAALSLFQAGKCAINVKKWSEAKELFLRVIKETQDERLRIQCEEELKQIP